MKFRSIVSYKLGVSGDNLIVKLVHCAVVTEKHKGSCYGISPACVVNDAFIDRAGLSIAGHDHSI